MSRSDGHQSALLSTNVGRRRRRRRCELSGEAGNPGRASSSPSFPYLRHLCFFITFFHFYATPATAFSPASPRAPWHGAHAPTVEEESPLRGTWVKTDFLVLWRVRCVARVRFEKQAVWGGVSSLGLVFLLFFVRIPFHLFLALVA